MFENPRYKMLSKKVIKDIVSRLTHIKMLTLMCVSRRFRELIAEIINELDFIKLSLSVITIIGKIDGLKFSTEKQYKDIENWIKTNETNIISIDCNFGHSGETKVVKKKSTRKCQGDGSTFSSQVQFHVRSGAKKKNGEPKTYKIKIFQNGKIQCSGVLRRDLSDCWIAINEIKRCLVEVFSKDIIISSITPTMINTKHRLTPVILDGKILQRKVNTSYLKRCVEEKMEKSMRVDPTFIIKYFIKNFEIEEPPTTEGLISFLANADDQKKYLCFDKEIFLHYLESSGVLTIYVDYKGKYEEWRKCGINFGKSLFEKIYEVVLSEIIDDINKKTTIGSCGITSYRPNETSCSAHFCVRYPSADNIFKENAIFQFESGKINIKGSVEEKSLIYTFERLTDYIRKISENLIYIESDDNYVCKMKFV